MSDFFEDLFNANRPAAPTPSVTPEKGVPLRGRDFNGNFYVRVDDVVALLELNKVLPKVTAQLKTRVTP